MKHYLVAKVDAKTLTDLVAGIDSIAASIEGSKTEKRGRAPDGSGRYNFKIFKKEVSDFEDLTRNKEIVTLGNTNIVLKNENSELKKIVESLETKLLEARAGLETTNKIVKEELERSSYLEEELKKKAPSTRSRRAAAY